MEDIKLFIQYLKENVLTFILVLTSPRSPEISEKIKEKENTKEISIFLVLIHILINSIYLSSEKSEVATISLLKLTLISFASIIFQSVVFRLTHNLILRKKESIHIFFNTLALSSTFNLMIVLSMIPIIESDLKNMTESIINNGIGHPYISEISVQTLIVCSLLVIVFLVSQLFFIFYQIKKNTNLNFKSATFTVLTSYALNVFIAIKTYAIIPFFLF